MHTKLVIFFDYGVHVVDFHSETRLSKRVAASLVQHIYLNHTDPTFRQVWEESYDLKSAQKIVKAIEVEDNSVIEKIIKGSEIPQEDLDSEYAIEDCSVMLFNIVSQFALRTTSNIFVE